MKRIIIMVILSQVVSFASFSAEGSNRLSAGDRGGSKIEPLMRGTLWWVSGSRYDGWSRNKFEIEMQAQVDVGFNLLWLFGSSTLMDNANSKTDVLEMIYNIADEKNMRVIIDLLPAGGSLPHRITADQATSIAKEHIKKIHDRYGHHKSFYGWYLNNELNPLHPSEKPVSKYWRETWKGMVDECHRAAPDSVVTISPFFLLDHNEYRGFNYLTPDEYARWWEITLKATGIDILMLQDSGEHLAFYTTEQREPFFASVAAACHKAGAEFWVNIETGEADVSSWDEYLELEREAMALGKSKEPSDGIVPWRFTPIEDLEKKLQLATKYADNIVNWGYYPFMQPVLSGTTTQSKQAYRDYKKYYLNITGEN